MTRSIYATVANRAGEPIRIGAHKCVQEGTRRMFTTIQEATRALERAARALEDAPESEARELEREWNAIRKERAELIAKLN